DATPEIPDYYAESHNRKVVEQNNNIIALVKKPNGIALSLYGIGLGIIVIISLLVVWLVSRKKRKKKRGELRTKHRNIRGKKNIRYYLNIRENNIVKSFFIDVMLFFSYVFE